MGYGVTVAQEFLVLFVKVRILITQQNASENLRRFLFLLCENFVSLFLCGEKKLLEQPQLHIKNATDDIKAY